MFLHITYKVIFVDNISLFMWQWVSKVDMPTEHLSTTTGHPSSTYHHYHHPSTAMCCKWCPTYLIFISLQPALPVIKLSWPEIVLIFQILTVVVKFPLLSQCPFNPMQGSSPMWLCKRGNPMGRSFLVCLGTMCMALQIKINVLGQKECSRDQSLYKVGWSLDKLETRGHPAHAMDGPCNDISATLISAITSM